MESTQPHAGPHQHAKIFTSGASLNRAKAVMIMVHGRGATAQGILQLADEFAQPDFHYLAPQANGFAWYPYSFLEPRDRNQPGLGSGLQLLNSLVESIEESGFGAERIILLGFSQGACLVSDYAARYPQKFGGIIVISGGLIGQEINANDYPGTLENTPVFLGCSDQDPHVPNLRIDETEKVFNQLGAKVDKRIYSGMGHNINEDEVKVIRSIMARLLNTGDGA